MLAVVLYAATLTWRSHFLPRTIRIGPRTRSPAFARASDMPIARRQHKHLPMLPELNSRLRKARSWIRPTLTHTHTYRSMLQSFPTREEQLRNSTAILKKRVSSIRNIEWSSEQHQWNYKTPGTRAHKVHAFMREHSIQHSCSADAWSSSLRRAVFKSNPAGCLWLPIIRWRCRSKFQFWSTSYTYFVLNGQSEPHARNYVSALRGEMMPTWCDADDKKMFSITNQPYSPIIPYTL